jgi:hypothetical protein
VLMLRANRGQSLADDAEAVHPLLNLLDQHGLAILGVEVLLIGIASVSAIVLDHYRGKRIARQVANKKKPEVKP